VNDDLSSDIRRVPASPLDSNHMLVEQESIKVPLCLGSAHLRRRDDFERSELR